MNASLPYLSSRPLPRFLWGDSLCDFPWKELMESPDCFEPVEFLAHTQSPRFICRIEGDSRLSGFPEEENIRVCRDEEEDRTVWKTNSKFYATDFIFLDLVPDNSTMRKVMRDACIDRQIRNVFLRVIG